MSVASPGLKWPVPNVASIVPFVTNLTNRPASTGTGADATGSVGTIPGAYSDNARCFGPHWIEFQPPQGKWRSNVRLMSVGDSRLAFKGVDGYSWLGAACEELGIPHVEYALQSDLRHFYGQAPGNHRDAIMAQATHLVDCYGQNDLALPIETMKEDVLRMSRRARGAGVRYLLATIYPQTQANTNTNPVNLAKRTEFNEWARTQVAAGTIDGLIDSSDALAAASSNTPVRTRNGGFFVTPDGATSYDGYLAPAGGIFADGIHSGGGRILKAKAVADLPSALALVVTSTAPYVAPTYALDGANPLAATAQIAMNFKGSAPLVNLGSLGGTFAGGVVPVNTGVVSYAGLMASLPAPTGADTTIFMRVYRGGEPNNPYGIISYMGFEADGF